MNVINFGSLNIDKVYSVKNIVKEGETIFSRDLNTFTGGKGLNQSIAVSRAGGKVLHAGAIGPDGLFLEEYLKKSGVDTTSLLRVDSPSGHAIIQVNEKGQNSIIVCSGANALLSKEYIDEVLKASPEGSFVLLQNETSNVSYIIRKAHEKGFCVVWNPSPFPERIEDYPVEDVDIFVVNEIEGALLSGTSDTRNEEVFRALQKKFPDKTIVLTLGKDGVLCSDKGKVSSAAAFTVDALDTTAAGDTFLGYLLSSLMENEDMETALRTASAASAIAVSRSGAAPSIPEKKEVLDFLLSHQR